MRRAKPKILEACYFEVESYSEKKGLYNSTGMNNPVLHFQ